MENSKMCNWVIISLGNTCVIAKSLARPKPSLAAPPKNKRGWGGCCCRRGSLLLPVSPKAFLKSCVSLCDQPRQHLGLSPRRGLQIGPQQDQQLWTFPSPGLEPEALQAQAVSKVGIGSLGTERLKVLPKSLVEQHGTAFCLF